MLVFGWEGGGLWFVVGRRGMGAVIDKIDCRGGSGRVGCDRGRVWNPAYLLLHTRLWTGMDMIGGRCIASRCCGVK